MKSCFKSIVLAFLCLSFASSFAVTPLKVTFLSPDPPGNAFWDSVIQFMKAVAEDLNIDLEILVGQSTASGTLMMKRRGLKRLKNSNLPDYFLTGYWPGATNHLIDAAEKKKVNFFVFNTPLVESDRALVGKPREKYPNWIGHMYPDDIHGGYILAESLAAATSSIPERVVPMVALGGNTDSAVSAHRVDGLKQFINEKNPAVNLQDVYATDWSKTSTLTSTDKLLNTFPNTRAIWAAADSIALYAAAEAAAKGYKPGNDIFFGGFDWSKRGVDAVNSGTLASSVGGHFMEGGWSLILIYDYQNGIDFKNELGTTIITKMQLIDQSNVKQYLSKFGDRDWSKIDFRKFSKVYNKNLKRYDFSLEKLFSQLD